MVAYSSGEGKTIECLDIDPVTRPRDLSVVIPGRAKREPGIHLSQQSRSAMDSGPPPAACPGMTVLNQLSTFSAAMNASCGMSTLPNCRIFFLPSFCFSRSLRLRVMSPP